MKRLVQLLEDAELPIWFDDHLGWGDRFTTEIRRRIVTSLAIIVVMSPDAERSEWVEREILEGQRHNRHFLPVLLDGSRFFLLASSNFFDARDGRLPGAAEIAQLWKLYDAYAGDGRRRTTGTGAGPSASAHAGAAHSGPADTGAAHAGPAHAGPAHSGPTHAGPALLGPGHAGAVPVGNTLPAVVRRPVEVSLNKLRAMLAQGQFAFADILTTSLLLQAADRLDRGWIGRADAARIPQDLLTGIDAAWSAGSAGRYGFGAQLALHPAAPAGAPEGRHRDFFALSLAVGWKGTPRQAAPRYVELVEPSGGPSGFFPTLRNPQLENREGWHDRWMETVMAVHVRLRRWKDAM